MQNIPTKVDGVSTLPAAEFNQIPAELETAITDTGQTLSGGILDQVSKAMATYAGGGDFYTDSGVADAYVLTVVGSKKAPTAYFNGMSVRFLIGNVNTGASTVNVATLGVKNIKLADGTTDPEPGQLPASAESTLTFDGTNFRITSVAAPLIIRALGNATQPGEMRWLEDTDNGVNYIGFKAPALVAANAVFELPAVDGAANEFLQTNGSKVLSFAAQTGAWKKIQSQTASASATIDFTGLTTGVIYSVVFHGVAPTTDNTTPRLRTSTDGGSSFDSGASDYDRAANLGRSGSPTAGINGETAAPEINLGNSVFSLGNAANEFCSGEIRIFKPSEANFTQIDFEVQYHSLSTELIILRGSASRRSAADVDAIRFLISSGTIAVGVFTLYELIA